MINRIETAIALKGFAGRLNVLPSLREAPLLKQILFTARDRRVAGRARQSSPGAFYQLQIYGNLAGAE
jgi:hypothetical protein